MIQALAVVLGARNDRTHTSSLIPRGTVAWRASYQIAHERRSRRTVHTLEVDTKIVASRGLAARWMEGEGEADALLRRRFHMPRL